MNADGIEYTTWHDQVPSHNKWPEKKLEAWNKMQAAWQERDKFLEEHPHYLSQENWAKLEEMTNHCLALDDEYYAICASLYPHPVKPEDCEHPSDKVVCVSSGSGEDRVDVYTCRDCGSEL